MRILLADDQKKVCSALQLLLGLEPGVEIVGETAEARHLLQQVEQTLPDVILLDWELPGFSPNGLLHRLHALFPGLKVIALSGRPEARQAALEAGVDAFVSKCDPPDRLLAALRTASKAVQLGA